MEFPKELKYTREHEWVLLEGKVATIGITDFAQDSLGDIVFLELPEEGVAIESGETFGVVESVKAVSDIYAPISGRIVEVNKDLVDQPEIINEDPYGEGWMIKVEFNDSSELEEFLTSEEYESFIEEEKA